MDHERYAAAARHLLNDAWPLHLAVAWIAFGRDTPPVIAAGAGPADIGRYQTECVLMERAARWLAQVIERIACVGRRPAIDGIPRTFGPSTLTVIGDDIRPLPCSIPAEWLGLMRTADQRRPGDIVLFENGEDEQGHPRFVGFHTVFVSRGDVERAFREQFGEGEAGREWQVSLPPGGYGAGAELNTPGGSNGLLAPTRGKAAEAAAWMRENVTAPGQLKRDAALRDCRTATGATHREALAAWGALPDALRGARGRPRGRR